MPAEVTQSAMSESRDLILVRLLAAKQAGQEDIKGRMRVK
jgi:hypothetical protein